jgi:hypothetical protein
VLYIAGTGRCGSTLLERILAGHDGVVSAGELHLLPHELDPDTAEMPCGCGEEVAECPFWLGVADRLDPGDVAALARFREHHHHGRTLRREAVGVFTRRPAPAVAAYGAAGQRVYRAVAGGADGAVVVDSSKDPYRLLWLARSGCVDLRVLHLTRHPSGFVRSVRPRPARRGVGAVGFAARKASAWSVTSALITETRRHLPSPRHFDHVRYEDLARRPSDVLERVARLVDLEPHDGAITGFRSQPTHALGGHPMRFESGPVRLDERWRTELSAPVRATVSAVSAPARLHLRLCDRSPARATGGA